MLLGVSSGISLVSTTFLTMYAGRVLGIQEFGKLGIALAISVIVMSVVDFGLNVTLAREISIRPQQLAVCFTSALLIKTVIAVGTMVVIMFTNYPWDVKLATIGLSLYSICISFVNLFSGIFQAREWFGLISAAKIEGILRLSFGVIFLVHSKSVFSVVLAYLLAGLITLVFSIVVFRRRIGQFNFHLKRLELKFFFVESSFLAIAFIIWTATLRQSTLILSTFHKVETVAIYEAANQWIGPISTVIYTLIATVVFPKIARFYVSSIKQAELIFRRSTFNYPSGRWNIHICFHFRQADYSSKCWFPIPCFGKCFKNIDMGNFIPQPCGSRWKCTCGNRASTFVIACGNYFVYH